MPVWRISPKDVDESDPDWRTTTVRKPVVIRADNLEGAFKVGKLAFGIATPRVPGETVPQSVWSQPHRFDVKELQDHPEQVGPGAVLEPPGHFIP